VRLCARSKASPPPSSHASLKSQVHTDLILEGDKSAKMSWLVPTLGRVHLLELMYELFEARMMVLCKLMTLLLRGTRSGHDLSKEPGKFNALPLLASKLDAKEELDQDYAQCKHVSSTSHYCLKWKQIRTKEELGTATRWEMWRAHLLLFFQRGIPIPSIPAFWRNVSTCAIVAITLLEGLGEQVGELKVHQLDLHICTKRGEKEKRREREMSAEDS